MGEAIAYIAQAKDFYNSGTQLGVAASRPLQLYYSFMNLAKALSVTNGVVKSANQAKHGLSERLRTGNRELHDAYLTAFPDVPGQPPNLFDVFGEATGAGGLSGLRELDVPWLLPQILPGHRIWAAAAGRAERFVGVADMGFFEDVVAKTVWLRMRFNSADLARVYTTHADFLTSTGLADWARQVTVLGDEDGQVVVEQTAALPYVGRAADKIPELVAAVKGSFWATVLTVPPYRRYYVYRSPATEPRPLSQLCGAYALIFYLGSITRYRPQHFANIIGGSFGTAIQEFITSQPPQFVYLLASEFARQQITQPAIV
jgi:YaaC-like Protein